MVKNKRNKRLTDLNQFNKPNYCERIYYLNVFLYEKNKQTRRKFFFLLLNKRHKMRNDSTKKTFNDFCMPGFLIFATRTVTGAVATV